MPQSFDAIDELCVNTIRTLAMDAVERANSGHPGAPMGLAPVAHVLFSRVLKHAPDAPLWEDRDRFVLSCGHASMLLYSVLHLSGYALTVEDLQSFRQWGAKTAGHPEWDPALGIEMTTGPLGQGLATSVGLALAEAHLASRFNRPDLTLVDHRTWVLCSDGDLMEGLSAEAAALAAHLGLTKLVWIWDDNHITIEGDTGLATSEDMARRFEGHGWRVLRVADGNDLGAVAAALEEAQASDGRPTLVAVRTQIAFGAPTKQGSASAHGAPLGEEELRGAKERLGWPVDAHFLVPDTVRERYREMAVRGAAAHAAWQELEAAWQAREPGKAAEWRRRQAGELPPAWHELLPRFAADAKGMATRAASGKVLNAVAEDLPELVGGSADLAPSCKTTLACSGAISARSWGERNLHFGIREHAMGALLNGLSLHGGIRPFGSTFLVFADYMRPAIRLAALMAQPVIFVFTHDSIWVGEDGPTHQPVEQLASLRAIPNLVVLRPADANETAAAWRVALERRDGPTALILSRQGLPVLELTGDRAAAGVARGAYTVVDAAAPALVIVASGSELTLATAACRELADEGVAVQVVSMPSWELFDAQPAAYRRLILPPGSLRLAVEAGIARGWRDYVGEGGDVVSIERFGASAPGSVVAQQLGMNLENVLERARALLGRGETGGRE